MYTNKTICVVVPAFNEAGQNRRGMRITHYFSDHPFNVDEYWHVTVFAR